MTITVTAPTAIELEQAAADAAEQILPATDAIIELTATYRAQRDANKHGAAMLKETRDDIGANLIGSGAQAFTHNGTVIARLTTRTTHSIDTAKIKKEDPALFAQLFAQYGKTTETEAVDVK